MYTDTVTLFCRREDIWYPYILHGVSLHKNKSSSMEKLGPENADTVKFHVRYTRRQEGMTINGYVYKDPIEWEKSDQKKSLRFKEGVDFFLGGEYDSDPIPDDSYRDGLYDHLRKTRDNVFMITTADGPFKLIPHFEIGGK